MSSSYYPAASYDHLALAVTSCVFIGMIALTTFFYYIFLFFTPTLLTLNIIVVSFITTITTIMLVIPFLFSPRGYTLTSTELIIHRPFRNIVIPYDQIVETNQHKWAWKGIRIAGSGGLYGYVGLFYFSGIGKVSMFVTNRNKMLLIKCINGKLYIISPNNPNFITEIRDKINNSKSVTS